MRAEVHVATKGTGETRVCYHLSMDQITKFLGFLASQNSYVNSTSTTSHVSC